MMKKDVNFGLFILIIATLMCFAGFTIYYQTMFKTISTEYKDKLAELNKVTQDLQMQKSRLNETSYELKIKVERETDLSERYNTIKAEKEKIETDIVNLQSELATKTADLELKESMLAQAMQEQLDLESQLDDALDDAIQFEDDLEEVCADIISNGGSSDPDVTDICGRYD